MGKCGFFVLKSQIIKKKEYNILILIFGDNMTKLSKKHLKLAKKAGFIFWGDEPHGPGSGHIDWSSDYSKELKKFAKLVAKETKKQNKNKK